MGKIESSPIAIILLAFSKRNKLRIVLLALIYGLASWATFYQPLLTRNITDGALQALDMELGMNLAVFAILTLGLLFANCIIGKVLAKISVSFSYDLKSKVFDKVLSRLNREYTAGDLITRVSSDCGTLTNFMVYTVPSLVSSSLSFGICLVMLITLDWVLGIVTCIVLPFFFLLSRLHANAIGRLSKVERELYGRLMHLIQYVVSSLPVIIGVRMQDSVNNRYLNSR